MTRRNAALTIVGDMKHQATACILTKRNNKRPNASLRTPNNARANAIEWNRTRVANPFDAGLIYGRPLIEKRCNFWENSRIGKPCFRGRRKWLLFSPFNTGGGGGKEGRETGERAMLTLFKRPNFLHFWRGANFAREINARFTRCYKDRIYVFVNPPPSLSLLRPFGAIFHSAAIGNIFAALPSRR